MKFFQKIENVDLTDEDLVTSYRRTGRLEFLADLYQRHVDLVYGVCLKYLSDPETAKDAVMNIFEELIIKLKQHQVMNFKSWLHVVAKNHCLIQLRNSKNIKISVINEDVMQSEENSHLNGIAERELQLDKMADCLETLPGEQQQCIDLFYLQKKSYHEIVAITGYEWNQVRSFIQNGRRNLKTCMETKL